MRVEVLAERSIVMRRAKDPEQCENAKEEDPVPDSAVSGRLRAKRLLAEAMRLATEIEFRIEKLLTQSTAKREDRMNALHSCSDPADELNKIRFRSISHSGEPQIR